MKHLIIIFSIFFSIPYLFMVICPMISLSSMEPKQIEFEIGGEEVKKFIPFQETSSIEEGKGIYKKEGCYYCHTNYLRGNYASNDILREQFYFFNKNKLENDQLNKVEPNSVRRTYPIDYVGHKGAFLGGMRIGPDLSNVGLRYQGIEEKLYTILYSPRHYSKWSPMPSYDHLFEQLDQNTRVTNETIVIKNNDNTIYIRPTSKAKALVSYLLSLKKDYPISSSKK